MSEYRDDLTAAHARIAELEDKVRVLEEEARGAPTVMEGRFPELEGEIARLGVLTDPVRNAQVRTRLSWIGAAFPLLGMVLTFLHQPVAATAVSLMFTVLLAYNFQLGRTLKARQRELAALEAKLADKRRIAELEGRLGAPDAEKVRVAAPEVSGEALTSEGDETELGAATRARP